MGNLGFDIKKTSAFVSYSRKGDGRALIIYPPHQRIPHVHLNELGFDEYLQKFPDKIDLLDLRHFFFGSFNCKDRKKNMISDYVDWAFFIKKENKGKILDFLINGTPDKEISRCINIIGRFIPRGYEQYIFVLAFPKQTTMTLCLAKYLKEENKKVIIARNIKNSYLTSPVRIRELMAFPFVDVVADSFENNIIDLISEKSLCEIEGIWYRGNGKIKKNKTVSQPIRLASLPTPMYKHLEHKKVKRIYYELSRGCVHQCDFCSHSEQVLDVRPIKAVIHDLKYLIKKFDCHHFHFLCTAVNFSRKYVLDLCHEIITSNINIQWGSYIFLDAIDDEIARKLHEAGCFFVDGGVESPLVGNLNSGKIKDMGGVEKNLELLKRNGIKTYVSFIIRGINHKLNEEEEIIKFALRNKENIDFIFLNEFEIHALNVKNIVRKNKGIKVHPRYVLDQGYYEFSESGSYEDWVRETFKARQNIKSQIEDKTNIKIIHCCDSCQENCVYFNSET